MRIAVVGCNHRTAPVGIRERVAFSDGQAGEALEAFTREFPQAEAVILSTCNRTELYLAGPPAATPEVADAVGWLARQRQVTPADIAEHVYHYEQQEAVEHLFRVVSSLDSMVLGESQILGQTKQALALATRHRSARSLLTGLFTRSFSVAKEVHASTGIGEGRLSVGSVALDFAGRIFSRFEDKTVLMIGAGKMGKLTLTHLMSRCPKRVWVTNRTLPHAEQLAEKVGAVARPFEELEGLVAAADIVIASTAATEPVLTAAQLKNVPARRKFRPMLLLDLGIPRNIDPQLARFESFYVYNIDDLQRIAEEHWRHRRQGVALGEQLIETRVSDYVQDCARREAGPIITAFRKRLHEIMAAECAWAMPKLKTADEADRRIIEHMIHRTIHKVLHLPTKVLNEQAQHGQARPYADTLKKLFDLPDDEGG